MACQGVPIAHPRVCDFDPAHVGRTLLSDAFDVDLDVNFAFDSNREGHGFSRAEKQSFESARLQAAP
jgi:hypothetical protein